MHLIFDYVNVQISTYFLFIQRMCLLVFDCSSPWIIFSQLPLCCRKILSPSHWTFGRSILSFCLRATMSFTSMCGRGRQKADITAQNPLKQGSMCLDTEPGGVKTIHVNLCIQSWRTFSKWWFLKKRDGSTLQICVQMFIADPWNSCLWWHCYRDVWPFLWG